MKNFAEEFKARTKKFAIDVIIFCKSMPKTEEAFIIKKQLIKSSTSVAANYRAVCRARSDAEFFSKLSIVVEEADESVFWFEVIAEAKILNNKETERLLNEATEILKIVSKSRKTAKENNNIK